MPISQTTLSELTAAFAGRLLTDEPLARHTSARIGGPVDAFLAAHTVDDLRRAAEIAWRHGLPLTLLGGGSNILISDAGVRGLAVHNQTSGLAWDGPRISAESGVSTISLARRAASRGLSGFAWAIGIPGTLGGAVYGNAGAHGGDMAGCLTSVEAITPDGPLTWSNTDLAFEYRASAIKRGGWPCVILTVALELQPGDPAAIKAEMDGFNDYRKRTQPPGATIGSMFKNPPGDYAGRLIDAAGLKGRQIGGAQISQQHGNFFLNVANATASDVQALADLARETVRTQFGVELELEIELIGEG